MLNAKTLFFPRQPESTVTKTIANKLIRSYLELLTVSLRHVFKCC